VEKARDGTSGEELGFFDGEERGLEIFHPAVQALISIWKGLICCLRIIFECPVRPKILC